MHRDWPKHEIGTFISFESIAYSITTENFMMPIIEHESGLRHGYELLAYLKIKFCFLEWFIS
jgi:hypothetical protein